VEINQLRYFKAVADSGKITLAAQELFISSPAISASIAALEQELNVELFHRTGNRLVLNRQGKIFLDYANYILDSVSDAKHDLRESLSDRKKNVIIGATSTGIFSDLFCSFSKANPQITLTTSKTPLRYINSAGLNSRFSFLFSAASETPAAYADACESIALFEDTPALMVHPDHPFAKKSRVNPDEISNQTVIFPRINSGMKELFTQTLSTCLITPPVFQHHDFQVAYALVKSNAGIALMTTHSKNTLTQDLVFVPLELPSCRLKQMLYWKKELVFSEEDQLFLRFVKDYYTLK